MSRTQICENNISTSCLGFRLAQEIKAAYPNKDIHQIAIQLGARIIYEKPVNMGPIVRISEYRKKFSQIAIFHKEYEQKAIAHELFHHLEKIRNIKLSRKESELEAEKFVEEMFK